MSKLLSKRTLKWVIPSLAVLAIAVGGLSYWKHKKSALPEGIAYGNGRVEAKLVDIAAKEPLRVKELLVDEGALVKPNQVVARMDTSTLDAELAQAKAQIAATNERVASAKADIAKQESQIRLAEIEAKRARRLLEQGAGAQRELDVRTSDLETTRASLSQARAMLKTATADVEAAKASAETVQTRINDATLVSPVTGRVLYRLTEPGEVLAAGGKALTLVNLEDIYMEIFLPAAQATQVKLGSDARITVDFLDRAVAGYVSFVSPEAQFTPKQVETKSEREKLMFRVKIQLPREFASQYVERVKTGIRGVGYVKLTDSAAWPPRLQRLLPAHPSPNAD